MQKIDIMKEEIATIKTTDAPMITREQMMAQSVEPPPLNMSWNRMHEYFAGMSLNETIEFFLDFPKLSRIAEDKSLKMPERRNFLAAIIMEWKAKHTAPKELFTLMKGAYTLHGKIGYDTTTALSLIVQSGRYDIPYYEQIFDDKYNLLKVRAYTHQLDNKTRREGIWIEREMIKEMGWNSKIWRAMPALMMKYRAATLLARQDLAIFTWQDIIEVIDIEKDTSQESIDIQKQEMNRALGN